MVENFNIWDGVYRSFEEVSGDAGVFDEDVWLDKLRARGQAAREGLDVQATISPLAVGHDYILPTVAALVAQNDGPLRILDFGGGLAATYFPVSASLGKNAGLDFHVVEKASVCGLGQDMFGDIRGLTFHSELPPLPARVDIVHIASALHYVRDWRGLLADLAGYRPRYLVLADVTAGDIPTFVTAQNYYGRRIPVWFWNIGELVSAIEALGFELRYKSRYLASILGTTGSLPMTDFPPNHRLENTCQLIFGSGEDRG